MSAAVRPTAAILRRTRYVPVTQCIARRWQTSGGQPASYDEMLDLMEAEYPAPDKTPPKPLPTKKPSLREQLAEQHAQQQHEQLPIQPHQDQPDSRSGPSTTYHPISIADPTSEPTPRPRTTGRNDDRSEPRYKSDNNALPRPPRRSARDEYKPRRVPPPM